MKIFKLLLAFFIAINLLSIIVLVNTHRIIFNKNVYYNQFNKLNVYDNFKDNETPKLIINSTIGFFRSESELSNVFTKNESSHMHDVKSLINKLRYFALVNLIVIILCLILLIKLEKLSVFRMSLSMLLPLTLLSLLLIFWFNKSFVLFHNLFFPQGNWQFPVDSTLIRLFPEMFFFNLAKIIIIRSLIISFGLTIIGLITKNRQS